MCPEFPVCPSLRDLRGSLFYAACKDLRSMGRADGVKHRSKGFWGPKCEHTKTQSKYSSDQFGSPVAERREEFER